MCFSCLTLLLPLCAKSKLCFVSPVSYSAFHAEWSKSPTLISLRTASGIEFSVGSQVFDVPESVYFGAQNSLVDGIMRSLGACGGSVSDLVLVGKASLLPGLADRLQLELGARGVSVEIEARPDRAQLAYSNAAMRFPKYDECFFVSKEFYDEFGPDVSRDKIDAGTVWATGLN